MNTRMISITYGITFIAVGLLGFIPNPLISSEGIFAVNTAHNIVHMLLGIVFIAGTLKFPGYENRLLIIMGLGGIAVTILGFLTTGNLMLGIIHANIADHWLHLGLGIVILASGVIFKNSKLNLPGYSA